MEIKQSKPMGATHYRIQKNGRYESVHHYKKIGGQWLWFSFDGNWVESKLNELDLMSLREVA